MTAEQEQLARIKQRLLRAFGTKVLSNEMTALEIVERICTNPDLRPGVFRI